MPISPLIRSGELIPPNGGREEPTMATNALEKSFIAVARHYDGTGVLMHFDTTFEVVYDLSNRNIVATLEYLGTGDEARDDVTCRVTRRVKAREGIEWAAFERLEEVARIAAIRTSWFSRADLEHFSEVIREASDEVDAYLYSD